MNASTTLPIGTGAGPRFETEQSSLAVSGAAGSIQSTGVAIFSASMTVWPVPPMRSVEAPSHTAMSTSASCRAERAASAYLSEAWSENERAPPIQDAMKILIALWRRFHIRAVQQVDEGLDRRIGALCVGSHDALRLRQQRALPLPPILEPSVDCAGERRPEWQNRFERPSTRKRRARRDLIGAVSEHRVERKATPSERRRGEQIKQRFKRRVAAATRPSKLGCASR